MNSVRLGIVFDWFFFQEQGRIVGPPAQDNDALNRVRIMFRKFRLLLLSCLLAAASLHAQEQATATSATATSPTAAAPATDFKSLDQEVQSLKKEVLDLNRELFVLEEELLFPANTQVAVFVSMDVGDFFAVDSVTLKLDNKEVANYLYTEDRKSVV